jgi:hypothetical protein
LRTFIYTNHHTVAAMFSKSGSPPLELPLLELLLEPLDPGLEPLDPGVPIIMIIVSTIILPPRALRLLEPEVK